MSHPSALPSRGRHFFMPMTTTLRHRAEYAAFRSVEWVVCRLSWGAAQRVGRGLGRLVYSLDARHRRIVRENLRSCDLGLEEAGLQAVSKDCFRHFGSLLLSTIRLKTLDREGLLAKVRFEGLEHWDAARSEGRGFIGLTGHYGNWEAMALALSALDRPLHVIGRELDNPLLEPHLKAVRSRYGNHVIPKAGAFRDSLKVLRAGGCVGFLLDQDALGNGVFVRVLGRWASTFPSAATLALKYDLPIVPIFSEPTPDGGILVTVEPPFRLPRTGDTPRDLWTGTQLMTQRIEARIRREPRWWFWMHRRFKTQPGEDQGSPVPLPPSEWLQAVPPLDPRG